MFSPFVVLVVFICSSVHHSISVSYCNLLLSPCFDFHCVPFLCGCFVCQSVVVGNQKTRQPAQTKTVDSMTWLGHLLVDVRWLRPINSLWKYKSAIFVLSISSDWNSHARSIVKTRMWSTCLSMGCLTSRYLTLGHLQTGLTILKYRTMPSIRLARRPTTLRPPHLRFLIEVAH